MASEDVIELGSSDDEAEPAPKKRKTLPNAMVHIPSRLPGVTIKPTKSNSSFISKGLLAKPVIIRKTNIKPNPATNILNVNSNTIRLHTNIKNFEKDFKITTPVQNKGSINPLSIARSLSKTQIVIKKMPSNKRLRNPIGIQGPKLLNNLPPGITIKPVHNAEITNKPAQKPGGSGMYKKRQLMASKTNSQEMLTVEIEDEDGIESTTASPLWYLRPEEQIDKVKLKENVDDLNMDINNSDTSMEAKNNMEPETKFVEITIEDSPVKAVHSKHPDIGKELTITIEDSPVKLVKDKTKDIKSDNDINETVESPQSKKKLNYPKEIIPVEGHVVEIEIDLKDSQSIVNSEMKSAPESPESKKESVTPTQTTEFKKLHSKAENSAEISQAKESHTDENEFHPMYQKFIYMCLELEDTDDMRKIVDKKIKAYYRQCPKEYVESEEFIDMVSSKIVSMKVAPEKMYLYIKDIVDELNLQRKMTKTIVSNKTDEEEAPSNIKYDENQYNSKKRRQIRKLEKTIKKLHRAIQKLEEQEVEFDDEEDSVYLLTERYKERMVRVHAKFCQLTNTKMPSEPRIHIEARSGRPMGPAKRLEKLINKKVPIGTPLPFPDFHDVLRCVRDVNEEEKLGWNDVDIMEEARDLFTRCGKKLQRRRQENEWRIAASRISTEIDPAEKSSELKQQLNENKTIAAKKESALLNKYVDRQNQLKLEAVEIGDKEAEESPIESEEEEEVVDDNKLEDKQKRKQRLRRLIKEKNKKDENEANCTRKSIEEKENQNEPKEEASKDIVQEKIGEQTTKDESVMNNKEMATESLQNDNETIEHTELQSDSSEKYKETGSNDSDLNKVESAIDELHLLEELHSENEANTSTLESSDSDTPISISDTPESDSQTENDINSCDVISIENSSYSESESTVCDLSKDNDSIPLNNQNVELLVNADFEIEYSSNGIVEVNKEKPVKEQITEEVEENILLASSDEEDKNKPGNRAINDTCINLKDDNISISETMIDGLIVEEENSFNYETSPQETNNVVEITEGSPDTEDNKDISNMMEVNIDDGDNAILEYSSIKEVTSDDNELPKDIVDIRSTPGVHLDASTDLQNKNVNKVKGTIELTENMDFDAAPSGNEKSEIITDLNNTNTNNKLQAVKNTINDSLDI